MVYSSSEPHLNAVRITGTGTSAIQRASPSSLGRLPDVASTNSPSASFARVTASPMNATHLPTSSIALVSFSGARAFSLSCANPRSRNASSRALGAARVAAVAASPSSTAASFTHSAYHRGITAIARSLASCNRRNSRHVSEIVASALKSTSSSSPDDILPKLPRRRLQRVRRPSSQSSSQIFNVSHAERVTRAVRSQARRRRSARRRRQRSRRVRRRPPVRSSRQVPLRLRPRPRARDDRRRADRGHAERGRERREDRRARGRER
mmetsp:Transcript_7635/g.30635  ORF Transcript_7635/g.30635 Transcript_7635/m.30635 type:complete len:266 (-) Transcript_7635:97-894(-)